MKHIALILFVLAFGNSWSQLADFHDTNFARADSIAQCFTAHPLTDLKTLADKLTGPLATPQEKFRAIYRWVCSNVEADYELLLLNKHNRSVLSGDDLKQWNVKFNKMAFEKLRTENKTICTGYAYLIRELAFHAGLNCEIINGYAKHAGVDPNTKEPINHSWNEIELNGKWYVCDATWSSGVYNLTTKKFIKKYDDRYFLMDRSQFFKTHHASIQKGELKEVHSINR